MFSLICDWAKGWANDGNAGDLRCNRTHYDVTVMISVTSFNVCFWKKKKYQPKPRREYHTGLYSTCIYLWLGRMAVVTETGLTLTFITPLTDLCLNYYKLTFRYTNLPNWRYQEINTFTQNSQDYWIKVNINCRNIVISHATLSIRLLYNVWGPFY